MSEREELAMTLRSWPEDRPIPAEGSPEWEAMVERAATAMADADYWAKLSEKEKKQAQNVRFYKAMSAIVLRAALSRQPGSGT